MVGSYNLAQVFAFYCVAVIGAYAAIFFVRFFADLCRHKIPDIKKRQSKYSGVFLWCFYCCIRQKLSENF